MGYITIICNSCWYTVIYTSLHLICSISQWLKGDACEISRQVKIIWYTQWFMIPFPYSEMPLWKSRFQFQTKSLFVSHWEWCMVWGLQKLIFILKKQGVGNCSDWTWLDSCFASWPKNSAKSQQISRLPIEHKQFLRLSGRSGEVLEAPDCWLLPLV